MLKQRIVHGRGPSRQGFITSPSIIYVFLFRVSLGNGLPSKLKIEPDRRLYNGILLQHFTIA